jgi:hypothetical protein
MHRPNVRNLVLAVLRCKGPMTDAELAWWVRTALKQNSETAKKKRCELTRKKEVRFAGKVKITESGRVQKYWELAPARKEARDNHE